MKKIEVKHAATVYVNKLMEAGAKCIKGRWYQDGVFLADNPKDAWHSLNGN